MKLYASLYIFCTGLLSCGFDQHWQPVQSCCICSCCIRRSCLRAGSAVMFATILQSHWTKIFCFQISIGLKILLLSIFSQSSFPNAPSRYAVNNFSRMSLWSGSLPFLRRIILSEHSSYVSCNSLIQVSLVFQGSNAAAVYTESNAFFVVGKCYLKGSIILIDCCIAFHLSEYESRLFLLLLPITFVNTLCTTKSKSLWHHLSF